MKTQLNNTEQQLEIASGIADACSPSDLYAADAQLGQLRALISATLAMREIAGEIRAARESFVALALDKGYTPKVTLLQAPVQPAPIEVREVTRPDRGPVTLALLIMGATIAALTVLCVVAVLA